MIQTILHNDGTEYKVERRGTGRLFDLYFVYAYIKGRMTPFYSRVYAINENEAISKARHHYAQSLGLT